MTTILAIDTATTACSVALCRNGVITSKYIATPREHTRLALPMVDELLGEAGISLTQVDALAFTAGPGSFTGLRIGFGVVQGLAFGASLPVLPVSTLATLALAGARKAGLDNGTVLPALDARMSELYWALYQYRSGQLEAVLADRVSSPEDIREAVVQPPDLGVGDGWHEAAGLMTADHIDAAVTPDAEAVVTLARHAWERGEARPVDEVDLVYIRNEVSWKKRSRIRQR